LAVWLRQKANRTTARLGSPYQEDCGWELPVRIRDQSYCLCMSGNADGSTANPDEGEWGIIVEMKRSISQRIRDKGKLTADDDMLNLVRKILEGEPTISFVHLEE